MDIAALRVTSKKEDTNDYRIGDKIKIYLNENEGNFKCTFGQVVGIDDPKRPVVAYQDYSEKPLPKFNRFVLKDDIVMDGEFTNHVLKPGNR